MFHLYDKGDPMNDPKKNWKLLKKIEDVFGTQTIFASHIGISRGLVSFVVTGRFNLTQKERSAWARALKCKPSDIFGS